MYAAVLVPTDGSEGTARAVEHAIELASRYDADLHIVSVIESPEADPNLLGSAASDELRDVAEEAIDDVIEQAEAADLDTIEAMIAQGTPHRVILDYVDEHDIDLVVMGTHGRTGLDRYLLGSVTERVVRMADVPVLTVPMEREDTADGE